MRIAMVGPFGFAPKKTMRSRAFQLARPLAARGHQLHILMPPWHRPEEAGRRWQEDGVTISYTRLGGGVPGITQRLLRSTLAWKPEVVHAFKPKAYSGLVSWWLWNFRRRRLRLVVDSDDWEGPGGWNELAPYSPLQRRFFTWQEQWGLRHNHALTVASRALQSIAWAKGVPAEKVHYLPNGPGIQVEGAVTTARPELAQKPVILLYSRLFEFDAGRLVQILERVRAAVPDLVILAVGAGLFEADGQAFAERAAAAGLTEAILDAGWLDEADLPGTLAAADVGIYLMDDTLLNRTKCPVKLADMLSVGLPVVAESVGQVPEYVVHGQTGLLRPSGDVDGLAQDLIWLLQDKKERERLAAGARAHVQSRFSWESLADVAESVY